MKKLIPFLIVAFTCLSSMAQDNKLWLGDFRVGITGGANYVLSTPHYNLGNQMELNETHRKLCPTIGLYLGAQKDMHGRWAWGIDEYFNVGQGGWTANFLNTKYQMHMDYNVHQNFFSEQLGAHIAYFTGLHTQVQAGAALYGDVYLTKDIDIEVTNATSAAYNIFGRIGHNQELSMRYNAGLNLSVGATYYLGNSFFFKGDLHYYLPVVNSGEYYVPGFAYDNELADMVTALGDKKMSKVALLITAGFLW